MSKVTISSMEPIEGKLVIALAINEPEEGHTSVQTCADGEANYPMAVSAVASVIDWLYSFFDFNENLFLEALGDAIDRVEVKYHDLEGGLEDDDTSDE